MIVDAELVTQLGSIDANKIQVFEMDPCGTCEGEEEDSDCLPRGSCTGGYFSNGIRKENTCTCNCKQMAEVDTRLTKPGGFATPGEVWYDDDGGNNAPFKYDP